jgi:hypothetical protein
MGVREVLAHPEGDGRRKCGRRLFLARKSPRRRLLGDWRTTEPQGDQLTPTVAFADQRTAASAW